MAVELRIPNHRRYCFLQFKRAVDLEDDLDVVWDAKRRLIAGTDIPAGFPARSALLDADYLVLEELAGANQDELEAAGLTSTESASVMAALE